MGAACTEGKYEGRHFMMRTRAQALGGAPVQGPQSTQRCKQSKGATILTVDHPLHGIAPLQPGGTKGARPTTGIARAAAYLAALLS
eukprot:1152170-Pelagomonas_calceolata.AAC.7